MAWECAECNKPEDAKRKMNAVCHHCGKPLCSSCHRARFKLVDDAYSDEPGLSQEAYHCGDCRRTHHLRASLLEGLVGGSRFR